MEGPPDAGAVDIPDGVTPEQVAAGERARQETVRHLGRRRVLDMDELAELKDTRPRLEKEFKLPGDSRRGNRIYMFSVDGTLRGERVTGCLMAGECIVVQADSFEKANNIAKAGLVDTVELALEYWEEANRLVVAKPMDAVTVDVGGGRSVQDHEQPDLATDPKLRALIAHVIGGQRWKH